MAPKMVFLSSRSSGEWEDSDAAASAPPAMTPAASSMTHDLPGDERTALRQRVLEGGDVFVIWNNELRVGFDAQSAVTAKRAGRWVSAMGECADSACPCSRHVTPGVRESFRDRTVELALAAFRHHHPPLR